MGHSSDLVDSLGIQSGRVFLVCSLDVVNEPVLQKVDNVLGDFGLSFVESLLDAQSFIDELVVRLLVGLAIDKVLRCIGSREAGSRKAFSL